MGRQPKPLPFKKGMEIIWLSHNNGIHLTEGEVTVVTSKDGAPLIHCRHIDNWGNVWKRSFSPVAGMFQENPFPIWQLRSLNGDNMKKLQKRAEKATKLYMDYRSAYQELQRKVRNEAMDWERQEFEKRKVILSHGEDYLNRVKACLGFKRPEIVKVKVNGEISKVRRVC